MEYLYEHKDGKQRAIVEGMEVRGIYDRLRRVPGMTTSDVNIALRGDGLVIEGVRYTLRDFIATPQAHPAPPKEAVPDPAPAPVEPEQPVVPVNEAETKETELHETTVADAEPEAAPAPEDNRPASERI